MKLYIKQQVFAIGEKFFVYDQTQREIFWVEGSLFSFGDKLTIYDMQNQVVAFLEQELFHLLAHYNIYLGTEAEKVSQGEAANYTACLIKKFALFGHNYEVESPDSSVAKEWKMPWEIEGHFLAHDYAVADSHGQRIAQISKAILSWGDFYEIEISDEKFILPVICIVLGIDDALEKR